MRTIVIYEFDREIERHRNAKEPAIGSTIYLFRNDVNCAYKVLDVCAEDSTLMVDVQRQPHLDAPLG